VEQAYPLNVAALVRTVTPCVDTQHDRRQARAGLPSRLRKRNGPPRACRTAPRAADGSLTVAYVIEGAVARLRIPARRAPGIGERLWQHTCCEIFIAREGLTATMSSIFRPRANGPRYAFARYRESMPLTSQKLDPRISVRNAGGQARARRRDPPASSFPPGAGESAARFVVVVEDDAGALTYWALRHPPGQAGFPPSGSVPLSSSMKFGIDRFIGAPRLRAALRGRRSRCWRIRPR